MAFTKSILGGGPPQFKATDISDPLTRQMLRPLQFETSEQRLIREDWEREALRRSKEIDEWLDREKAEKSKDKRKKVAKMVLVGTYSFTFTFLCSLSLFG
jgi:hypothetical protein